MEKYIKPSIEIILVTTAQHLLLQGSHDVNEFEDKEDPDVIGGDDVNNFNRNLWEE